MNPTKRAFTFGAAGALALNLGTAWSFTAEQAAAGRAAFAQFCEACHGADLQLSPTAKLAGPEFLTKWQGQSTNDLVAKMRTTMPPESPENSKSSLSVAATPLCGLKTRPAATKLFRGCISKLLR